MAKYTTEIINGETVWFSNGEQCAHVPEGLLLSLLKRTLRQVEEQQTITVEQAEEIATISVDEIDRLDDLLNQAWPMVALDTPEQYEARIKAVEEFRKAGLIA